MSPKEAMLKRKALNKEMKMKKLGAISVILLFVLSGLFIWLLGQSGPENANSEIITVDIKDDFER